VPLGPKQRILEVVLGPRLDYATLVPTVRKAFDILAEGLLFENSRGDRTAIELFADAVAKWDSHLRQYHPRQSRNR